MKNLPTKYFLFIFLLVVFLLYLSPLEYDNPKFQIYVYLFLYGATAIVLIKWYRRQRSTIENILIPVAGIIYLFASCNHLLDNSFCRWMTYFDSYTSKSNNSVKLVCRSYECYGTDGDCKLYKQYSITTHLKWVTKFNEKAIDTTLWKPVDQR